MLWAAVVEPRLLVVRRHTVALDGWPAELDGLRIACVSDLHTGAPHVKRARVARVAIPSSGRASRRRPTASPSVHGERYSRGLVREGRRTLFVTSGIGTSGWPLRLLRPPEIALLTLTGAR